MSEYRDKEFWYEDGWEQYPGLYPNDGMAVRIRALRELKGIDTEVDHIKADEILLNTLRYLAVMVSEPTAKSVELLIEAYDAVGKWYS